MSSKRSKEGYLQIDNSQNEGVPDSLIDATIAAGKDVVQPGRTNYECATVTCSHCHTVVILRPDRSRPRNYCSRCDHYVCDKATCVRECLPLNKVLDDLQNAAFHLIGKEEENTHGISIL